MNQVLKVAEYWEPPVLVYDDYEEEWVYIMCIMHVFVGLVRVSGTLRHGSRV